MSDDEMMDDDEYSFQYEESSDGNDSDQVDIENEFYTAKGNLETDKAAALAGLQKVVDMQPEKGEWGFKALKQMVKVLFQLGRLEEMMVKYTEMLTYVNSAVTKNRSEKVFNKVLDFVANCPNVDFLQTFYDTTLTALHAAKNERLWFKANMKLAKLWFDKGEYTRLQRILRELHKSCQDDVGGDDQKKGTQLLELYALEIQMHTEKKNNKKLKETYQMALRIKSAIPHPLNMGVIHECGGKMHMCEREWDQASTCFFDAFKSYDEAGNAKRIQCLKYLVLAKMLSLADVNIFEAPEVKPYKSDAQITAMTSLMTAYQRNDIFEFESILKESGGSIMDDSFIRLYVEDLLRNIRTQVLVKLIKPYTRIRLPFISKELNIPEADVETLLVSLILDQRITGHIDQVNQMLLLTTDKGPDTSVQKYDSLQRWSQQLSSMQKTLTSRLI